MSTKYAILHKIGIYNWLPSTHTSHVTKTLATLLFQIGTRQIFNLRRLVFDNILRYVESFALKLGIGYPSFIFGILKGQSNSLLLRTDTFSGPPCEIRLNPKMFQGLHKTDTSSGTGCHTPVLDPTRLADPKLVRGARTYTGTLYLLNQTVIYPSLIIYQHIIYKSPK